MKTEGHGRKAKQLKILQALRDGATRRAAAAYAQVCPQTFYLWLEDSTFLDAVTHAEAEPQIACATSLCQWAKKDWRAALAWLERRYSNEWREKKDVNIRDLTIPQLIELATAGEGGVESEGDRAALEAAESTGLSE